MAWDADGDGVNDSQEWVDMLTDEGYTIDFRPAYWDALTEDLVVELNTADLVIVSATTQSGVLTTDAAEAALWNSVTAPMMNCCTYALRSTRWNWVNNGDAELPNNNGDQGSPLMQVLEPGHPIFTGISLDANNQLQAVDPTLGSGQCTFIGTADAGNGTLIAKTVGNEWLWIAEWKEGVEFYDGAGTYATNLRMTFSIGGHEVAGNGRDVNPARGYNLTDEGWRLYLNAVQYMLGISIIPGKAGKPKPINGTRDVPRDAVLSWRPGIYAATHNVYLGTDPNDVNEATVDVPRDVLVSIGQAETTYQPAALLDYGVTYYWRIDEVNDMDPESPWKGDVWSFTTANYIVVEDFEDYNDFSPNEIWNTWIDGYGDPTNGATAGYPEPDFFADEHYMEDEIVHGGSWSMPVFYDNTEAGLSEVTKTLNADWTQDDVVTLTMWYYGDASNAIEPIYVALDGDAVVTNDDPKAALDSEWNQWDILLQDFTDQGVNLTNVNTMSIGFGNKTNPQAGGGTGHVFFDDIRLYRSLPKGVEPEPEPVDPGIDNLVAYYAFENNVQDGSGNGYNGTLSGNPQYIQGPTGYGMAMDFDGNGDYVTLPIGSAIASMSDITVTTWANFSNAGGAWQRLWDFGTGEDSYMFVTPRIGNNGQLRFAINTEAVAESNITAPATLPSGWHHVTVTIDSASMTMKLYQDGKLVAEGETPVLPSDLGQTTQNWLGGRSQFAADAYYQGSLDEFRIYNRALSAGEIRYLAGK